ncbi:MAG: hypothetical protein WC812_03325 [Candidatus Pacearchaeota archaeon]|jgi:hypothetical protein
MGFINAKVYPELKGKVYLHSSGKENYPTENDSLHYLMNCIANNRKEVEKGDYFISILWSNSKKEKLMDFFRYSGVKENWESNPDISPWVVNNGIWRKNQSITCGDGIILLGREEEYRRCTKNLNEYLSQIISLENLKDLTEFI